MPRNVPVDVGSALDRLIAARQEMRAAERAAAAAVLAEAIAAGRLPEQPDPAVLARIAGVVRAEATS